MDDLIHNQNNLNDVINNLNSCISKLESELNTFNSEVEVIKRNWSGTEFEKANVRLGEIKETLERAIADNREQVKYYENQNNDFTSIQTGL